MAAESQLEVLISQWCVPACVCMAFLPPDPIGVGRLGWGRAGQIVRREGRSEEGRGVRKGGEGGRGEGREERREGGSLGKEE